MLISGMLLKSIVEYLFCFYIDGDINLTIAPPQKYSGRSKKSAPPHEMWHTYMFLPKMRESSINVMCFGKLCNYLLTECLIQSKFFLKKREWTRELMIKSTEFTSRGNLRLHSKWPENSPLKWGCLYENAPQNPHDTNLQYTCKTTTYFCLTHLFIFRCKCFISWAICDWRMLHIKHRFRPLYDNI